MSIRSQIGSQTQSLLFKMDTWFRYNLGAKTIEWEYMPNGWNTEQDNLTIKGWDVKDILEVYKAKWPIFVKGLKGTQHFGISHESNSQEQFDLAFHNTIMSYAYALTLSARFRTSMSMLDWGGGIGHYYLISKALIPDLDIDYHCKDVTSLVGYGRKLFPEAHFYTDNSCLNNKYNFVLASTSLHYSQDWSSTLKDLAEVALDYLFINNLPILLKSPHFVFVQRPYKYGYNTEYLGWCLNRGEFLNSAENAGLKLVREFINGYKPYIYKAPEQNEYRGYLFKSIKK